MNVAHKLTPFWNARSRREHSSQLHLMRFEFSLCLFDSLLLGIGIATQGEKRRSLVKLNDFDCWNALKINFSIYALCIVTCLRHWIRHPRREHAVQPQTPETGPGHTSKESVAVCSLMITYITYVMLRQTFE